jgi:hypothetical protein
MHKILFCDKFIKCLYMFRALCAHHQEDKIVLYSIWYHHACRWPSGAQVEIRVNDIFAHCDKLFIGVSNVRTYLYLEKIIT